MLRNLNKNELYLHMTQVKKSGYTKISNFIKEKYINLLLSKVIDEHKKINKKTIDYVGMPSRSSNDLRVFNLVEKDKIFIDLISDYNIEKILKPLLNDPYYQVIPDKYPNYIIGNFTARSSGNKLDLHIDSRMPFKGSTPTSILLLFVLERMDSDNGATILVPKSHLSGRFSNRNEKNYKIMNARPGDVLVLDSRLWHGTTKNNSSNSRWLINAIITQWWIKQQLNIPNTIPKKIFSKLSNKQKQLLGFCSIPPDSINDRTNVKCGYDFLKKFN